MNTTKIRPAARKDLSACEKLGKIREFRMPTGNYFKIPYLKYYLNKNLFLVAEKNNSIIGLLIAEPIQAKGALLWFFTVKKSDRGKGIGKKLIKEFERNCGKLGIEWIILHAPLENKLTGKFYKKAGYAKGKNLVEFEKLFI